MALTFHFVDVFAENKYEGNQLAVIRGGGHLSTIEMQRIAKEMNYSETTFITNETVLNNFPVRIFTPDEEIPFAGHPTLGTAFVIQKYVLQQPIQQLTLNLKAGQIPVDFPENENEKPLWMTQLSPTFGETIPAETIAEMLNLKRDDIDNRFPAQVVSTGTPFILAPIKSLAAMQKAQINRDRYFEFIEHCDGKSIYFFSSETIDKSNAINARLFADAYGIPEDPATGSAAGCLAGWLVKHRYFSTDSIDISIEQGLEIRRPSRLYLRAKVVKNTIEVKVGGRVIPVAEGVLV